MVPWPQNMEVTTLLMKYVHFSEKGLQDVYEGDIDFCRRLEVMWRQRERGGGCSWSSRREWKVKAVAKLMWCE